jgi:hypothetical protein
MPHRFSAFRPHEPKPPGTSLNMSYPHHRHTISCEIDGKTYQGNYWVAGMILVVSTAKGGSSTQLAGRPPAVLAERLLRKLAKEGKV